MSESSVLDALRAFVHERDWEQFHTPENLAKGVSIEAAELLECFQWGGDVDPSRVKDEIADVLTYCFLLADKMGESPSELILEKLEKTKSKYPVEKSHGRSTKYTDF
jgi:NTP pyrophosphatase (non-canonical NTP hydrolase)